jgi:DHA1 family bicyclomycin/chloramphenicol resistance-like MFS transporter
MDLFSVSLRVFSMRHLGVAETGFPWLFGPAMPGLPIGSWWSGWLAGKLSPQRAILLALDRFPEQRGLAASCQMFLQSTRKVLLAGAIAPLAWGSALSLSIGMACLALTGSACSWLYYSAVSNLGNTGIKSSLLGLRDVAIHTAIWIAAGLRPTQ